MKKLIYLSIIMLVMLNSCSPKLTTFSPNKEFIKDQPNYLSNQEYDFSSYINLGSDFIQNYTYDKNWKYNNLNSKNYPLKNIEYVEKNLPTNLNCYILFPREMADFDNNIIQNKFLSLSVRRIFPINIKTLKRFKQEARNITTNVISKNLKSQIIKPLKEEGNQFEIYDNVEIKKNNILLVLVLEKEPMYFGRKLNNLYPSVIQMSLNVYNYKFDLLKVYKQAAFFKNPAWQCEDKDIEFNLKNIIPSLLGQFSNDLEFLNFLKNVKENSVTEFDRNIILFKKHEQYKKNIINNLETLFDFADLAKSLQESNAKYEFNSSLNTFSNQLKYSLNDAQTNREQAAYDAAANGVFSILDDISRRREEKDLRTDKETIKRMVANYQEINKKQIELLNYFSENKYLDMSKFNIDVAKDNSMLTAFQNSINEGAAQAQNQLNIRGGITKNDMQQNQAIFANGTKTTTNINAPETNAITNTTLSSPNAPECNKISENELKTSLEYQSLQRFNIEGGSLGAKEQRVQAKLMELTIKNCRSHLSVKEIQVLEDAIRKAIKIAVKMEDEFKKSNKMNLNK